MRNESPPRPKQDARTGRRRDVRPRSAGSKSLVAVVGSMIAVAVVGLLVLVLVNPSVLGVPGPSKRLGMARNFEITQPELHDVGVAAGVELTDLVGPVRLDSPGDTLDGVRVRGAVIVAAPDVVIRDSLIVDDGGAPYGVLVESGGLTISDSEIKGFATGLAGDNWAATRVRIHGASQDGAKAGSHVLLEKSWIHDLRPEPGAHADGVQVQAGVVDVLLRDNVIDVRQGNDPGGNAAIFIAPDLGPDSAGPVRVVRNRIDGGNYTLFCLDGADGKFTIEEIDVVGNRFGRTSRYGPMSVNVPVHMDGNVWHDSGKPLG